MEKLLLLQGKNPKLQQLFGKNWLQYGTACCQSRVVGGRLSKSVVAPKMTYVAALFSGAKSFQDLFHETKTTMPFFGTSGVTLVKERHKTLINQGLTGAKVDNLQKHFSYTNTVYVQIHW